MLGDVRARDSRPRSSWHRGQHDRIIEHKDDLELWSTAWTRIKGMKLETSTRSSSSP
jgi:hypothetical protein